MSFYAVGKRMEELGLQGIGVQVSAVRRLSSAKRLAPEEAGALEANDVVVLLGVPEALAAAEMRLEQG
jgi:CPA2 family monovalent cation:H+ antiporter-2